MLLLDRINLNTKKELLTIAENYDLCGVSSLRKAELAKRIVSEMCAPLTLRTRLSCLSDEQMSIFRKAVNTPQEVSVYDIADAMQLFLFLLGEFENPSDRFTVYEEIAETFKKIDDADFRKEQDKRGWLVKCVHFFLEYYGVAPLEVIYQMYRLKEKGPIEEMIHLLYGIPMDVIDSAIFPADALGMDDYPKGHPLYTERGMLVSISLSDKEFNNLLDDQADKPFFIPTTSQLNEIARIGYEMSCSEYREMQTFFEKKLHLPNEQAISWCLNTWVNSHNGNNPVDMINEICASSVVFSGEKQMREFVALLMNAHNNTRMKENRGHKPSEIRAKVGYKGTPTIVPGSTNAAKILGRVAPELAKMGIPVDVDATANIVPSVIYPDGIGGKSVTIERKIYPNDPCPCGSGKKYKKCCGAR